LPAQRRKKENIPPTVEELQALLAKERKAHVEELKRLNKQASLTRKLWL